MARGKLSNVLLTFIIGALIGSAFVAVVTGQSFESVIQKYVPWDDPDVHQTQPTLPMGPDVRQRVVEPWSRRPYQAIAYLHMQRRYGQASCSGSLIAPRVVLTAKHCLLGAEWANVYLGYDDGQAVSMQRAYRFRVSQSTEDYGVILLDHTVSGVEPLRMGLFPQENLDSVKLFTAGYPGDKITHDKKPTLWEATFKGFVPWRIRLEDDCIEENVVASGGMAKRGQSGSPLFDAHHVVRGVRRTRDNAEIPRTTYFVPIRGQMINELKGWIAMS